MSVEYNNMILNPYSRLFEHISDFQSVIVVVTRNPLQAMDSTIHTLCTAENRSSRNLIPLGNTETLQRSLFNMINENTLRMIPFELEAISDSDEDAEKANEDTLSVSSSMIHMIYDNPLRVSNRTLRSQQAASDSEDSEENLIDEVEAVAEPPSVSDTQSRRLQPLPAAIPTIPEEGGEDEDEESALPVEKKDSTEAQPPLGNLYQDGTVMSRLYHDLERNGTLTSSTDMIESFRVITRNLNKYCPTAYVFDMVEDNSHVRMKIRRMIKALHNDLHNDLRTRFLSPG